MLKLEDELGDIIAKARIGQGCTVEQLAQAAKMSPASVQDIERYRLVPGAQELAVIAETLDLDPDKLADIAANGWQPAPISLSSDDVQVHAVAVPYGAYGENCYLFTTPGVRVAAVVDPGGAVDEIDRYLSGNDLELELVLITHGHGDHTGGLRSLAARRPSLRLVSHTVERDSVIRRLSVHWEPAKDKVSIPFAGVSITPLATPGHTPGSVCYSVNGVCFVGDTLFAGSIGRPEDSTVYKQMLESINAKILSLPDDTILLPGHGPATTVAEEKAHNPFF